MLTRFFAVRRQPLTIDLVLLLLRLVIGYTFLVISWGKIQNPANWMQGITFAGWLQTLAAVAEFGGGIALVLGLLTRLGAFGITCVMVVAIGTHILAFGDPYINFKGGSSYQVAAAYLLIMLLLLATGPGRFSLDRVFFGVAGEPYALKSRSNKERTELESA
jgi:putative oxidoreductase